MKPCLDKNAIEIYSTFNKEKSAVPERFIITLKSKIYKYITSISKNAHIDKLDDIVNRYNNTYHRTIKMKPADVKAIIYFDFNKIIIRKILNLKLAIL